MSLSLHFTLGAIWKIHKMDAFIESLLHDQDKLIKRITLKNTKYHPFSIHEVVKTNFKYKKKFKVNKDPNPRKGGKFKPFDKSSNSKEGKGKKGKSKCSYCNKGYHRESSCM